MKQTLAEKYMTARTTSSLKLKAETTSSPADILTAAGMVGHRHGLAMQLWSVMHSPSLSHITSLSDKLAVRLDGYMQAKKLKGHPREIALRTLDWWLHHTCKRCGGTGKERIEGTPHLSDTPCLSCNGTGATAIITGNNEAAEWLLKEIDALAFSAETAMGRRIK